MSRSVFWVFLWLSEVVGRVPSKIFSSIFPLWLVGSSQKSPKYREKVWEKLLRAFDFILTRFSWIIFFRFFTFDSSDSVRSLPKIVRKIIVSLRFHFNSVFRKSICRSKWGESFAVDVQKAYVASFFLDWVEHNVFGLITQVWGKDSIWLFERSGL